MQRYLGNRADGAATLEEGRHVYWSHDPAVELVEVGWIYSESLVDGLEATD